MNITLPSHTENALRDIAARARQPPELYVREIIIKHLREVADSPFSEVDEDVDPTAFDRAMARMKARTPADIAQARTRLLAQVPPPELL